jgi:CRP-like cAMP-binding protein
MDANYLEIELSFRVAERSQLPRARNELYDLVFRHTEASGLQLASDGGATRVVLTQEAPEMSVPRQTSRRRLLDAISLFSSLTSEEREELASAMNRLSFKEGDIAAHRDTSLTSLMILRSGVMTVEEIEDGQTIELERLAPGDVFGERGVLMGALEPGDIKAITAAVVYEIPKERLAAIMRERPAIAEELAMLLSARSKAEERLHMANHLSPLQHASSVSARIRHLFGLG